MPRTFKRDKRLSAIAEPNVTPLIDLAFSLLIIFMIATPLLEQTIPLDLPLESRKPQQEQPDVRYQSISVNSEGRYFWGDEEVTFSRLTELVTRVAEEPDPPVINIRADFRLQYQKVIDVIDLIKSQELTRISLDTRSD